MTPADVARAALMEAGRPDLANNVVWFEEEGGYLELMDEIDDADTSLVDKAERIARQYAARNP